MNPFFVFIVLYVLSIALGGLLGAAGYGILFFLLCMGIYAFLLYRGVIYFEKKRCRIDEHP